MRRRVVSLVLALCLSLMPMSALAADSTVGFTNDETYLRTSYNENEYLDLTISGDTLTVNGVLSVDDLMSVVVRVSAFDGDQRAEVLTPAGKPFSAQIRLTHSRTANVDVYTHLHGSNWRTSYVYNRIVIEKTSSGYRFMPSLVLDRNLAFWQAEPDPDLFRDSSKVPDSVKTQSEQIVGSETDDYTKIFLLHEWVAENIYYDWDAYRSGTNTFLNSADILANKRTICDGYSSLLRDMILAQGIPCMKATTYALGASVAGGSFAVKADEAETEEYNHAHVEAWVDGRWGVMDATWDSNNRYEAGSYEKNAPSGFYYFDITPEAFALDHKYITRANGLITMQDGMIVNRAEKKSTEQPTQPTPPVNTVTATPNQSAVLVNGQSVSFDAYNINNNNYFKLRDLAQALNGSEKQFEVLWDGSRNEINLISGWAYTSVGGEMAQGDGAIQNATPTTSVIRKDGTEIELTAYTINGNNYFKLRDIGIAFDFDVSWDSSRNTITIDTAKSYTAD